MGRLGWCLTAVAVALLLVVGAACTPSAPPEPTPVPSPTPDVPALNERQVISLVADRFKNPGGAVSISKNGKAEYQGGRPVGSNLVCWGYQSYQSWAVGDLREGQERVSARSAS